ncbi:endonuclease/exonuclease/phosphatase family protein [Pelagibacterium montanilacus]|uniref:endonuclease/exonuclease/phosphatase family protein n=1 Tax=Pelagibacterium montanilacus TaxID=2185280 RepID=UPI000F8CAC20|nr:endonuclease/exonuclease/phosphatase family protein [Pelagibacterium montanilacus]
MTTTEAEREVEAEFHTTLDCLTWNVHRGRCHDGRFAPSRVHDAVVTELAPRSPAVLALQEADFEDDPQSAIFDTARLATEMGLVHAQSEVHLRRHESSSGFCGTMLLVHEDMEITARFVLDLPGHWHRGAVVLEGVWNDMPVRLVTAHLSRLEVLRLAQMRTIGQFIMRRPPMQTILLGDLNDWQYWRGLAFSRRVVGTRFAGPARATFPVSRPLLPLDRILTDGAGSIEAIEVLDSPLLRRASDHLPLWGRVAIRPVAGR